MEKKEFHIGDIVFIRQWNDMAREFGFTPVGSIDCECTFTFRMKQLCGKIVKICWVDKRKIGLENCNGTPILEYYFSIDMIEHLPTKDLFLL